MPGDSLLPRREMTSTECYKALFLRRLTPQFFHHTLRHQRLLTAGFRLRLILYAVDEMASRTAETALGQMTLPGGRWRNQQPVTPFFLPVAHFTDVDALAVTHCADPLALTACAPVHAGGNRQALNSEMVLGIEHLPLFVGVDASLNLAKRFPTQPEGGIH